MSTERNREILKKRLEDHQFTRSEKQVVSGVSRRTMLKGVAGLGIATTLGGGLWTLFNRGGTETKANSVQPEPAKTTPVHTVSSTNVDTTETTESKPEEAVSTDVGEAEEGVETTDVKFDNNALIQEVLKMPFIVDFLNEGNNKDEMMTILNDKTPIKEGRMIDRAAGVLAAYREYLIKEIKPNHPKYKDMTRAQFWKAMGLGKDMHEKDDVVSFTRFNGFVVDQNGTDFVVVFARTNGDYGVPLNIIQAESLGPKAEESDDNLDWVAQSGDTAGAYVSSKEYFYARMRYNLAAKYRERQAQASKTGSFNFEMHQP